MRSALAALLLLSGLGACTAGGSAPGPSTTAASPEVALRLQLADAALAGGSAEDAIDLYRMVRLEQPGNLAAMTGMAAAQTAAGDPVAALATYQEAHRLAPHDRAITLGLARKLLDLDRSAEAETILRPLVAAGGDVTAANMLGVALDYQARHAEAQTVYRAALTTDPASIPLRNNLALSLALSGEAREAIGILQLLPPSPRLEKRIRHNLAVALSAEGDEQAAARLLAEDLSTAQLETVMDQLQALQPDSVATASP